MTADALATALFFVDDADKLAALYDAAYLRIHHSGTITLNKAMESRIELFL